MSTNQLLREKFMSIPRKFNILSIEEVNKELIVCNSDLDTDYAV